MLDASSAADLSSEMPRDSCEALRCGEISMMPERRERLQLLASIGRDVNFYNGLPKLTMNFHTIYTLQKASHSGL